MISFVSSSVRGTAAAAVLSEAAFCSVVAAVAVVGGGSELARADSASSTSGVLGGSLSPNLTMGIVSSIARASPFALL